ncbi:hypothetical protein NIES208_02665 [[Limnothrix rosea] IAM M-220]|nr:hypothetical protein NIES208_02665 [[Limnothrix rosea] IAM M-220]
MRSIKDFIEASILNAALINLLIRRLWKCKRLFRGYSHPTFERSNDFFEGNVLTIAILVFFPTPTFLFLRDVLGTISQRILINPTYMSLTKITTLGLFPNVNSIKILGLFWQESEMKIYD